MKKAMLLLITGIFLLVLGAYGYWMRPQKTVWEIAQGEKPIANPLKGWACWGEILEESKGLTLAYVPVYWRDLEKEEGVYDFESLEKQYHFQEWRERETRLILRVVADSPSLEGDLTIPQWLYQKMDGDGAWYDNDYGKGFSPNYENKMFIQAHKKLLTALGKRYDKDPQIAWVQLGSLGHWGEWHVHTHSGIQAFPNTSVTDLYVKDYVDAFPHKKLLMRRPYGVVNQYGLGLYNDSFGILKEHERWMGWIQKGYLSDQNGQKLPGAPDFWKKAPSGGEIASAHEINWYFSEKSFSEMMQMIKESHTTFLGPHIPKESRLSKEEWQRALICQQEMGFCLAMEKAVLSQRRGKDLSLDLWWKNLGNAPFYEDWDIRLVLKEENGGAIWKKDLKAEPSSWLDKGIFSADLPGTCDLPPGRYEIWAGLLDPMTGRCSLDLAVELPKKDGMYQIGIFQKSGS